MPYSKMDSGDWKYPATAGDLVVSENPKHTMHWEEYGNPEGEPVIFMHGGPGGACDRDYARFFNPKRYRIILYDQRGCGLSKPHVQVDMKGAMAGNITENLIEDIEKLRADRGITGKAHIFGGSWGSTLAMAYAEAHPEHVQDLVLRGIFLCDKTDLGFFYQGNAATYETNPDDVSLPGAYRAYRHTGDFTIPPELHDANMVTAYKKAWHDYVTVIPPEKRGDMIAAYHEILNSDTIPQEEKLKAAMAWTTWEGVTSYLSQDVSDLGKFSNPKFALAFATIENEYFYRSLRGEDKALSELMTPENITKLAQIPTYIVGGAYDQVCVPQSARSLKAALESAKPIHLEYYETQAGHSMKERTTNAKLTEIMDNLPIMQAHALGRTGSGDRRR